MNNIQQDFLLLPNYFKKIAFGIMLLSVFPFVLSFLNVLTVVHEIIWSIARSGFLISLLLLLLTMTRNKIEDELTLRIRLKAYNFKFISWFRFLAKNGGNRNFD